MKAFEIGSTVAWEWGQGEATGTVHEVHKDTVTKQIDGSEITRHGTGENPAYEIVQEDGGRVLKLHSELEPKQ